VTDKLDRRTFLARGATSAAGLAVLGGGGLLAACGSSSKSSSTATTAGTTATTAGSATTATSGPAKNLGSASLQLSWIKNVEFAGSYIADTKGYYKQEGIDCTIVAGGPTISTEPVIVAGKSIIGITSPDFTAAAINKGANLIVVGCQYQRNPFAIMSLASKPIKTPQDMYGKKIGVQATNETIWNAFIKLNSLDASKINKVPVQFDPSPLVSGTVDAWFSFFTNEPNLLKSKGVDTFVFLLDDFGYHILDEAYIVSTDSLTNPDSRAKLKAILRAEIRGWQDQLANPGEGASLAATKYGKDLGLDTAEQTLEATAQNQLIQSDTTKSKGLFYMSDTDQQRSVQTMALAGITIDAKKLFTNELLDEIYQGKSSL